MNIEVVGRNRFHFKFFHPVEFSRVASGAPWTFNNKLVALVELVEVEIHSTPIWVQVFGIPIGLARNRFTVQLGLFR